MLVLVDQRANAEIISALSQKGFEPILLPPARNLQLGVSSHADMLMFIGFGRLFCHASFFEDNKELISRILDKSGLLLVLSDEKWEDKYPADVLFNACLLKERLICNIKTVSRLIPAAAQENDYEIIDVPQGYTKCSVCIVSDNAIITSDKAIAAACAARGIDVLSVCEGHVCLPPYNYGFIGGASGAFGNDVYFCGSLDRHPDGQRIKEFCKKHNKNAVCLSNNELQDLGSLLFLGDIK